MSVSQIREPKEVVREPGITLRYKECGNNNFHAAMQKLDQFVKWKDPKDIHRFNKLKKTYDRECTKAGNWYKKLVMKHAVMEPVKKKSELTGTMVEERDEKGEVKMRVKWAPSPSGEMSIQYKDLAAFEKDEAIFHSHEFHIKVYKLFVEDLLAAGLVPAELRACAIITHEADEDLLQDDDDIDLEDYPEDLAALLQDEVKVAGSNDAQRPGATAVDVPGEVSGRNGSADSGDVVPPAGSPVGHEGSQVSSPSPAN